ncbi:hypothetical protein KP509_10G073200 [Ceratopteris richardii]|uniref:Early light-induced protein n=1 Tax=Ceratopteris richardii TaxID=49495 RepID=A0A8T2TWG7_CERRI|nr:hypothetical protein KP509_10G073200 [Ceratopteris richardii]
MRSSNTSSVLTSGPLRRALSSARGDNHRVQARSEGDSIITSLDRATKEELTREDIQRQQDEASSEERSFLGTRPASRTPWPRSELERRPETESLFAVDGAAPETINGRMAMLGFVWAYAAEKMTGLTVMEQLFNPSTSGILWFAAVVQLFTVASIVPFINGESTDARRWGPFNGKAERWNGRLAMIGFVALLIDELIRQTPVFG